MKQFAVAIDGPSGAGKSTVAKAVAARLRCAYLDTGAIYRTAAVAAARAGVSPEDPEGVSRLIGETVIRIVFPGDGRQHMLLNGEDVTDSLRTPEISQMASQVSAIPAVRAMLLEQQRAFAASNTVVMDGRDIGTVVLPDAEVKIFLTASAEVRAARRLRELREKGISAAPEEILADVNRRDERDSMRAAAPLRCAPDAVRIDSSDCGLEETIGRVMAVIRQRVPALPENEDGAGGR